MPCLLITTSRLAKSCKNVIYYFMVRCGLSGWYI
ncbi:unnamed protein product, partial [Schistosoma curassoni]|uniref:Uncharacterized protein n=1 Tax=Schistosoma curassoni TaxID=6186 RepID=A0A183KP24_9TREM